VNARSTLNDPGARRIAYWALATVATLVLLLGYRTSTGPVLPPTTSVVAADRTQTQTSSSVDASGSGDDDTDTDTDTPASDTSGTYTGDAVQTRWGPVQVQITVTDGTITDVTAVQVPDANPKDIAINSRAVPVLHSEVLAAQSADIDTVSGATDTSVGYIGSLQSAIDEAGL